MSDLLGRIPVPVPVVSTAPVSVTGAQFPLVTEFGYGYVRPAPFKEHQLGGQAALATQRFFTGFGPRKFAFRRAALNLSNRRALRDFWESTQGSYKQFSYAAPLEDQTVQNFQVVFETQPLTLNQLITACQVGFNFVECPDTSTLVQLRGACPTSGRVAQGGPKTGVECPRLALSVIVAFANVRFGGKSRH